MIKLPKGHHWILTERKEKSRFTKGSRVYTCKKCKQSIMSLAGDDPLSDWIQPCEVEEVRNIMEQ